MLLLLPFLFISMSKHTDFDAIQFNFLQFSNSCPDLIVINNHNHQVHSIYARAHTRHINCVSVSEHTMSEQITIFIDAMNYLCFYKRHCRVNKSYKICNT